MKKVHFINNLPKNKENNEIHMLPCSISFSGSTDTNEYFYKKMNQINEKKDEFRNSYLGREIFGKKTPISAGICNKKKIIENLLKLSKIFRFGFNLIFFSFFYSFFGVFLFIN